MTYLALGVIGFVIIHLSDPAAIKKLPGVKPIAWVAGMGLLLFSIVEMWLAPSKLDIPLWLGWLAWPLLGISSALITYSLFISLPFFETYVATGSKGRLITTGLYSLVRHPWVHWHVLFMAGLTLVSKSSLIAYATLVFSVLDLAGVIVQDRIFFPRMFAGYGEYQQRTPMLIPTRKSMGIFLGSLRLSAHSLWARLVSKQKEATHVHLS